LISGLWLTGQLNAAPPTGKVVISTPADKCETGTCGGDFGTSLKFEKTPSDAARKAVKEEKLVFVLHVSGLFENPDFT
jgi:hypothetical protein